MAKGKPTIKSAGGIGESKIFCAPEGEFPENRLLGCHINGVAIRELNLDPMVLSALDYYATDEGVAEKNARPMVREPSGIEVNPDRQDRRWVAESSQGPGHWETRIRSTDEFGKALDQKRDDVIERGMPSWMARDPLKETADKYAKPGMKPKFLSKRRIQENGGTGDYVVVKDEKGDPVSVRGMILGHMPTEMADARNKHYRDRGNNMIDHIKKTYKEEGGKTAVVDKD
jgi:hypothetical protein